MNELITTSNGPFDPSLKMNSLEIAEAAGKRHDHVMRDIRELISQMAIDLPSFGEISYLDSMNRQQPAYELNFEATMTLVTGYDAKMRSAVIKRWMSLERGEAVPALANASAIDAMATQLINMVVPAVIKQATAAIVGQITPQLEGLQRQVNSVQINFSHTGTVWSFSYHCCQEGNTNTYVTKEELYEAYCAYCGTIPYCRAEGKSSFLSKLYRAFVNTDSATITMAGRRVPVVRGISLLPGYKMIIEDLRRRRKERDAQELARRREQYCGIERNEV